MLSSALGVLRGWWENGADGFGIYRRGNFFPTFPINFMTNKIEIFSPQEMQNFRKTEKKSITSSTHMAIQFVGVFTDLDQWQILVEPPPPPGPKFLHFHAVFQGGLAK